MTKKTTGVLKVVTRKVADLIPYELNAKKHDPAQVAQICASILAGGYDVPIVVDREGVIIKGHGRRLALLELGIEETTVIIRTDLTPEQVRAHRLNDNHAAISDIDSDILRAELEDMGDTSLLQGVWSDKDLTFLDADLGAVNNDAFVDDMDLVLSDQKKDVEQRIEKAAAGVVPLAKAFGFKVVSAADQLTITNLMARAEAETGMKNADALVMWAKKSLNSHG